jgi:hypothetical protein
VLEGTTSDGRPEHWVFSEIAAESFRWRAEELREGKWVLTEEMRMRRG